jgi:hypothetical protein
MENFRLKVFRTVADNLNFRQAPEALYLTQPAITLQIKALEEELGVPLFDRTANVWHPLPRLSLKSDRLRRHTQFDGPDTTAAQCWCNRRYRSAREACVRLRMVNPRRHCGGSPTAAAWRSRTSQ